MLQTRQRLCSMAPFAYAQRASTYVAATTAAAASRRQLLSVIRDEEAYRRERGRLAEAHAAAEDDSDDDAVEEINAKRAVRAHMMSGCDPPANRASLRALTQFLRHPCVWRRAGTVSGSARTKSPRWRRR